MTDRRVPRAAWAIVGAAIPVHLALALATDLSPDEAYYLCAARLARAIDDHPPLTLWLLAASDRVSAAPVELRVRLWAVLGSVATSAGLVVLARDRGAGPKGCTLAAWVGTWALLPMAGGFVTTPDTAALLAIVIALVAIGRASKREPRLDAWLAASLALFAAALAKVVALPVALLLSIGAGRSRLGRVGLVAGPLLALPLLAPSLRFQLRHAFASTSTWSLGGAVGALGAAVGAQALLWSPFVLWRGALGARALPTPERALAVGLTALVLVSAFARGVPPEPNWWAPAALVLITGLAATAEAMSAQAGRWLLAGVLLPTALAVAHTARPFLPLSPRVDPTARLHGWSAGARPIDAAGLGDYGAAAERCVYSDECETIRSYFEQMHAHGRGDP